MPHLEELLLEILLVEFSEFPAQVPITPDHKFPSHHGTPDHRSKDQKITRSQVALTPDHRAAKRTNTMLDNRTEVYQYNCSTKAVVLVQHCAANGSSKSYPFVLPPFPHK